MIFSIFTKSAAVILVMFISMASTSIASAEKKSGNRKTSPTPSAAAGSWVLPSAKSKSPLIVQAGRSFPIKFKLADSTGQITSPDLVQVSLNALSSCEVGATLKGTPVDIVPATPIPTVSPSPSPSTSESKEPDKTGLKVEKGTFSYVWKIAKEQSSGCYQLVAKRGNAIASSPIFKIKTK